MTKWGRGFPRSLQSRRLQKRFSRLLLFPGAIVHCVLIGGAGFCQAPTERPLVGTVEAFASVGFGRRIQDARKLEVTGFEFASCFFKQVMRIFPGILLDCGSGLRL